jgi:hypothetical protein
VLTAAVQGPLEVARDGQRVSVLLGETSKLAARLILKPGAWVRSASA